jgi:L-alanine-DL-glutamate epimerase-like enolase superfamily enzyme
VATNDGLVQKSLAVLEPLYRGENALEPERVSAKLHQHMFWLGMGGSVTHTISGIDIALWDLLGKATGQPVGRLIGGRHRERVTPYASLLMEEPASLSDKLRKLQDQGYRAFKIGWGPFGRRSSALACLSLAAAPGFSAVTCLRNILMGHSSSPILPKPCWSNAASISAFKLVGSLASSRWTATSRTPG